MKDEIKEILEFDFQSQGERIEINEYERDILKDYITNLQTIEQQYSAILSENAELENKITNLQEENEHLDKVNCQLRKKINNDIYKSRNEKALDKLYCYGEVFDSKILQQFQKEMENILQGVDKE